MVGNFIADFVKGNKKLNYPDRIRQGIELHRQIDHFTDTHPVTAISRRRLYERHSKYSGVVVDLFYDHFLAKNFTEFSGVALDEYAARTYKDLHGYFNILPDEVKTFLPFMVRHNWLLSYSSLEGIGRTLTGLSKRVSFENRMDSAVHDLSEYYAHFEEEFRRFFPELITFAEERS